MARAKVTTDHEEIRRWVEQHGGHPAAVRRTESGDDPGILRIDFPGYSGEQTLDPIAWEEFFQKFDESKLAFLYQDQGDSRFNKLISRESSRASGGESGSRGRSRGRTRARSNRSTRASSNRGRSRNRRKASGRSSQRRRASGRGRTSQRKRTSARASSSSRRSDRRNRTTASRRTSSNRGRSGRGRGKTVRLKAGQKLTVVAGRKSGRGGNRGRRAA